MNGIFSPPDCINEPLFAYEPHSEQRSLLSRELDRQSGLFVELPHIVDGREVCSSEQIEIRSPHNRSLILGQAHWGDQKITREAIQAAKNAASDWSRSSWEDRATIFLKAAELLSGPWRMKMNAATMLGQSKTAYQAEIDSAAELIDFLKFNVAFMRRIYEDQPVSPKGVWNRTDYRPLEGFVYAITPFNFTAIAGNLPTAPALMGNTVIWKPSASAMLSAHYFMQLLREAGLPDGVINLVYGDPVGISETILADPDLAGIHFTGSTSVFNGIMSKVGSRIENYRSYPRIVGETGGKNFILAHESADMEGLATAIIRGGYEYQGQKCSAASRIYIPDTIWPALRDRLVDQINSIKIGDVSDLSNFMGAVIDARAFNRHKAAIDTAREEPHSKLWAGGYGSPEEGYFVHPTLIETEDFHAPLMKQELFGPIVTTYVYPAAEFTDFVRKIDETSHYGLTGAIFARDRKAVQGARDGLRFAAGNFYINDKPTGAIVGQQPFGGARASGTNDKAGSILNLLRWTSPRSIKETLVSETDYTYPHMMAG